MITKIVSDFIITEIQNDDLEFSNLFYKQIFELYKNTLLEFSEIDNNIFLNHKDTSISKLSAELLGINYLPSKIWKKKGSFIKMPEITYKEDVEKAMLVFKLKIILMAFEKNMEIIKQYPKTDEEFEQYKGVMQKNLFLEDLKKELSELLGRVIL